MRSRARAAVAAAGVVCLSLVLTSAAQEPAGQPAFGGKLYRSALTSGPGTLAEADLAGTPDPLRSRLAAFLARRAAFKSAYKGAPETLAQVRADAKRRVIERSIVALVDAAGVERTAVEFVSEAPIAGEWNGQHQGPAAEAAFAEDVLKKDPSSPLAPWLYVFIAERQRIVFEALENARDLEGMKAAARKYRTFASRARSVEDPIYRALIDDIEGLPYLYINGGQHPRDYDPDT